MVQGPAATDVEQQLLFPKVALRGPLNLPQHLQPLANGMTKSQPAEHFVTGMLSELIAEFPIDIHPPHPPCHLHGQQELRALFHLLLLDGDGLGEVAGLPLDYAPLDSARDERDNLRFTRR